MDAGLAALGQGWPFAAALRINVGLRACRAKARDRVVGQEPFAYFWASKVRRRKGATLSGRYRVNGYVLRTTDSVSALPSPLIMPMQLAHQLSLCLSQTTRLGEFIDARAHADQTGSLGEGQAGGVSLLKGSEFVRQWRNNRP